MLLRFTAKTKQNSRCVSSHTGCEMVVYQPTHDPRLMLLAHFQHDSTAVLHGHSKRTIELGKYTHFPFYSTYTSLPAYLQLRVVLIDGCSWKWICNGGGLKNFEGWGFLLDSQRQKTFFERKNLCTNISCFPLIGAKMNLTSIGDSLFDEV